MTIVGPSTWQISNLAWIFSVHQWLRLVFSSIYVPMIAEMIEINLIDRGACIINSTRTPCSALVVILIL